MSTAVLIHNWQWRRTYRPIRSYIDPSMRSNGAVISLSQSMSSSGIAANTLFLRVHEPKSQEVSGQLNVDAKLCSFLFQSIGRTCYRDTLWRHNWSEEELRLVAMDDHYSSNSRMIRSADMMVVSLQTVAGSRDKMFYTVLHSRGRVVKRPFRVWQSSGHRGLKRQKGEKKIDIYMLR